VTLRLNGSTSGYTEIDAPAVAGSNTLVLPTGNGTSGQVLTTNGSGALSWALPGKILQVVQASTTPSVDITSSVPTSRVSLSLTPSSSSNKVLLFYTAADCYSSQSGAMISSAFYRNGSSVSKFTAEVGRGSANIWMAISGHYLDSPATTSAITYAVYHWNQNSVGTIRIGDSNQPSVLTAVELVP
jgi:hypothetical protein